MTQDGIERTVGQGRFVYTDDTGVRYVVRLGLRFGKHPALGFEPYDINDASVQRTPGGSALEMRYVNVVNAETKRRHCLPVGKLSAPILTGPERPHTLELLRARRGQERTFVVTSYIGEKKRSFP